MWGFFPPSSEDLVAFFALSLRYRVRLLDDETIRITLLFNGRYDVLFQRQNCMHGALACEKGNREKNDRKEARQDDTSGVGRRGERRRMGGGGRSGARLCGLQSSRLSILARTTAWAGRQST